MEFKDVIRHTNRKLVKNPLRLVGGTYEIDFEQLENSLAAGPQRPPPENQAPVVVGGRKSKSQLERDERRKREEEERRKREEEASNRAAGDSGETDAEALLARLKSL